MKNDVKDIIVEAVLEFLNEGAREEKPFEKKKKIPVDDPEPEHSFDVTIQGAAKKKPIIHPSYHKPSVDYTAHGVNEEEQLEEEPTFDENTKKKFLRAMGKQVNESMNLKS
jgi:hypothetical protein